MKSALWDYITLIMDNNVKEIGKYSIAKELGKGGMATVYLAMHKDLGREVALKLMHPHLAADEESCRRFELEAKAVAKLEHTNVVQIYDFGSHNGLFYIAMELVQGKDVEKIVKANGALPAEIAAIMISGIAGGLASAHKNGIIHRDVKPANFILKSDGVVKLSDFGIVKIDGSASMTKSDSIVGTPYYIAPEQIDGAKASPASDIYALGVSLYFMITGKYPYKNDTLPLVLAAIAKGNYMPVREALSSIPAEMAAIVERMMQKDPQKRYADAQHIVQDLNSFLYKRQRSADPSVVVEYMADPNGFSKKLQESGIKIRFDRARTYAGKGMVLEAFQELESILQEDPENNDVKEELEKLSDLRLTKTRSKIDGATMVINRPGRGNSIAARVLLIIIAVASLAGIIFFASGSPEKGTPVSQPIPLDSSLHKELQIQSLSSAETLSNPAERAGMQKTVKLTASEKKRVSPETKTEKSVDNSVDKKENVKIEQKEAAETEPQPVSDVCKGELSVVSELWGTLFVNGEKSGSAPTKLPLVLKCGDYSIRIESPSGAVAEKVFQVASGSNAKARFREADFK
ncbi:MAG: serine/threonine protein kinase [Fibrobacteres bacterium]|nr:serine/threonine protein kinase [Fibrobacterota bacterium]